MRGRVLGAALGAGSAEPIYHLMAALTHWDTGRWDYLLTEIDAGQGDEDREAVALGQTWACGSRRVHAHRGAGGGQRWLEAGERIVDKQGMHWDGLAHPVLSGAPRDTW